MVLVFYTKTSAHIFFLFFPARWRVPLHPCSAPCEILEQVQFNREVNIYQGKWWYHTCSKNIPTRKINCPIGPLAIMFPLLDRIIFWERNKHSFSSKRFLQSSTSWLQGSLKDHNFLRYSFYIRQRLHCILYGIPPARTTTKFHFLANHLGLANVRGRW